MQQRHAKLLASLDHSLDQAIRDPLWSHIYVSGTMRRLIDTPEFSQLARIKQLGPTYLVYPGATHTRFNHSLGVFQVARRLVSRLLMHPDCPPLSSDGVWSFLVAALLHDVGHFPYTHSFKSLPLIDHEQLTGRLILDSHLTPVIKERLGLQPEMVAAIVDHTIQTEDREVQLFRALLSGGLDPDKLDYLNRDAYFCGVPYGLQDIDFALSRVVPNGYRGIALLASGVTAVETILFSKYLMYRAVYWHRNVRAATAMIKRAVHIGLESGEIEAAQLYGLDDEELPRLLASSNHPAFAMARGVGDRKLLVSASDIAYSAEDPAHRALESDAVRRKLEARVAAQLQIAPHEVILDLPDPIGFEADVPVRDRDNDERMFPEASVFSTAVVGAFTAKLRRIRLLVPPGRVDRASAAEIFARELQNPAGR